MVQSAGFAYKQNLNSDASAVKNVHPESKTKKIVFCVISFAILIIILLTIILLLTNIFQHSQNNSSEELPDVERVSAQEAENNAATILRSSQSSNAISYLEAVKNDTQDQQKILDLDISILNVYLESEEYQNGINHLQKIDCNSCSDIQKIKLYIAASKLYEGIKDYNTANEYTEKMLTVSNKLNGMQQ